MKRQKRSEGGVRRGWSEYAEYVKVRREKRSE
jgi:hypothetical protein